MPKEKPADRPKAHERSTSKTTHRQQTRAPCPTRTAVTGERQKDQAGRQRIQSDFDAVPKPQRRQSTGQRQPTIRPRPAHGDGGQTQKAERPASRIAKPASRENQGRNERRQPAPTKN